MWTFYFIGRAKEAIDVQATQIMMFTLCHIAHYNFDVSSSSFSGNICNLKMVIAI
jgi:hypothetical protein